MRAFLRVVQPGLLTTVQDLGRWGWQSHGVPVAGAMDPYAHRLANALVGNSPNAATLEITLAGPLLECEDTRVIAITGAEFAVEVNDEPVPMNAPIVVAKGAPIRFKKRRRGARAYLAVDGGIDVPPLLGSRSTHVGARMGGHAGRALRAGDALPLSAPRTRPHPSGRFEVSPVLANDVTTLRIIPGPHGHYFESSVMDALTSSPYVLEPQSDRMGFRLRGVEIKPIAAAEMISQATIAGALQIPPSGQPILLMADRQTAGGYPILGSVISADVGRAAQLAPGDRISFSPCTRKEALAALLAVERRLLRLEERVSS